MAKMAYCLLKQEPVYRHQAFYDGLLAAGYIVSTRDPRQINSGDLLVIWNRSGTQEVKANAFEKCGGTVVVAENGYIGGDSFGKQLYALAIKGHNGSGTWVKGDGSRWQSLNIQLKPWRSNGGHILVCPNRHIGSKLMRMPSDWVLQTTQMLKWHTNRPIRVRPHPGNWQTHPPSTPLEADLKGAYACVIWSSSAGVHALARGIPVLCLAPHWICKEAAFDTWAALEAMSESKIGFAPLVDIRQKAFEDLAWAQWTVEEIKHGLPFKHLLGEKT